MTTRTSITINANPFRAFCDDMRDRMHAAAKSRAFALMMSFAFWFAIGCVLGLFFSALANLCVYVFGQTLGIIVYLIVTFGLEYFIEIWTLRRR